MAFIDTPVLPIKAISWTLDRPSQVNVSNWTGARTVVTQPWCGKWSAKIELAPIVGEANVRAIRSFLARCLGSINTFRVYATEGAQNSNIGVTLASDAAAGATSINIDGASSPLLDGQFFTIKGQLCCCTADQAGTAVTFEPPLRQASVAATTVVTSRPYALMYMSSSSLGWDVGAGQVYGASFEAGEAVLEVDGVAPEAGTGGGIFFNTDTGDAFTGSRIAFPSDSSLTVSSSSVVFTHTGSDLSLDAQLKDINGNVRKVAFTDMTFEATYTVRPFDVAGAAGVRVGLSPNDALNDYGGMIGSHGGSATKAMAWTVTTGGAINHDDGSGPTLTGGVTVLSRVQFSGDSLTHTVTYPSGAQDVTQTMDFTADSSEMPVLFSALGLRFERADLTLTRLKIFANYPSAKFGFLGDSITQGRFASSFANGFAAKVRADYPGQVMIAGAPSAQTSDWKTAQHIQSFVEMTPQYAFVMLGTNDITLSRTVASIETDYTSIIASLVAADIEPILLAVPPNGSSNTPTLNTWLAGLRHRFIDTYTPLLGTGTSMNATYDHGDGIHPNDAGHSVIHSTIAAYITAQAL